MTASLAQPIALSPRPAVARRQVRQFLAGEDWQGDVDAVALALHEALVNAERHAGGTTRAEAAVEGMVLVIRVWDGGPGFDPRPYVRRPPDPMAERGRGLWLISRVASSYDVRHDDRGVALVMRFDHDRGGGRRHDRRRGPSL